MRGSIALAAIAAALAMSAPAARAQTSPATAEPVPPTAPPTAEAARPGAVSAGEAAKTEAAEPAKPDARVPIVGYELGGSRIDPADKLQALLLSVAAIGDPFVSSGPSDRIGRPFGTIPGSRPRSTPSVTGPPSPPAPRRAAYSSS